MANPQQPNDSFGPIEGGMTLDKARHDSRWVDTGIVQDSLSTKPPFVYTVIYNDGTTLTIPLEYAWFQKLSGPTVLLYRRHKASGRLVPFQALQTDRALADPSLKKLPANLAYQVAVPPRFDPWLTPFITTYLNQAQWLYLGESALKVFRLHLMNPVLGGWRPGISGTAARSAGVEAAAVSALRSEARALVQAARVANGKVVVNLAGTGEVAGAINVNPLIDQQVVGVPNLLKMGAEKIGEVIPGASVDMVVSNNVVFGQVSWAPTARGCFAILRSGGTISIAPYAAQFEQHVAAIVAALRSAGFANVKTVSSLITAVKP